MSPFLRFFQKGEIKRPNGQYVSITKSIPQPKPLPPVPKLVIPKPKIDPAVKQFFEKDVKTFIEKDVRKVAVSLGKNFENALMMPQKLSDALSAGLTSLNNPIFLPILLVVGAVVVVQVIKK